MKEPTSLGLRGLASLGIFLLASCSLPPNLTTERQDQPADAAALIERGKYLTTIEGCHDCHSPKIMTPFGPEPDPARLLSGHPASDPLPPLAETSPKWLSFSMDLTTFVGPWGVSFGANLTPDQTGLGGFSYEQFQTVMRKGKYRGLEGSRDILPPMPWQMFRNLSDADLRALFAYLKSLKPIHNLVPQAMPPLTRGT